MSHRGLSGSASTFLRMRRTCSVTVASSCHSPEDSHTWRSSRSRLNTCRLDAARKASRSNATGIARWWLSEAARQQPPTRSRSEEHTSELQSLMRISYAVFCLKKKNQTTKSKHKLIPDIKIQINTQHQSSTIQT